MAGASAIELHPIAGNAAPDLAFAAIPHTDPFCCAISIDEGHLSDVVAHVNNIEIVRWLDRAAELHADSGGFTRPRMLEANMMWFVARHEVDYLAEAFAGDVLVLATWVRNISRVKSWRDSVIVRPSTETVICRAATLWVLVDLISRRPTRISQAMMSHFQPLHPSVSKSASESSCTSR